ncbi:MAG: MFS transporter [Alphaproteobacteria bacterium]|nr:MFS transporter [Alphaproteobacteria bacterium]
MSAESAAAPTAAARTGDLSTPYKIYVLALLVLVYISNYADRILLGILLPAIKAEFGLTDTELGFLHGTSFAIFYATLGVPIAIYADRGNRKLVIVAATATWSAMTALCGMAQSYWQLVAARIGVGVGEAGSNPPSHSIISDLFTLKYRGTALAIFSQGVSLGIVVGLYGGAQVAEAYGWRVAFYALGLPGLAIALLVLLTLVEPRRGASDGHSFSGEPPSFVSTLRFIGSQRSLVHILIGSTLATLVGYSGVLWWPSFIMRSHGLSPADMSAFLALVFGLGSGFGIFLGGYLSDYFGRRDVKLMPRVVAVAILIGIPFGLALYIVDDSTLVFLLIGIPAAAGGMYLGPSIAMVQSLVAVRMRTVASALFLFIINLIGMGLGSLLIGGLSDGLKPTYGDDALRYALLIVTVFNIWAIFHYWRAGRFIEADLKTAAAASAKG